jgi:hypothetical protein
VNLNRLAGYREQSLEQDDPSEALRLFRQAQDMEDELGAWPEFNVHDVRLLCEQVLEAAKRPTWQVAHNSQNPRLNGIG